MEKRLREDPDLTFHEFCKLNNIMPRYLSGPIVEQPIVKTKTHDYGGVSTKVSIDSGDHRREHAHAVDKAGVVDDLKLSRSKRS